MWLYFGLSFCIVLAGKSLELNSYQEAAFQGRCDHGSACDQLCYELHDGMYECACTYGYQLNTNGYSCQEINSTYQPNENLNSNSEEDVLYQRGASFSAELDMNNNSIVLDNTSKKQDTKSSESISKATQVENDHSKIDYDYGKVNDDGDRWILGDSEQVNFESTSSVSTIKTTIANRYPLPSTITITTIGSINNSAPIISPAGPVATNVLPNENHFPNKTKASSNGSGSENNQNNFHVKSDIVLTIDSNKSSKDTDDSVRAGSSNAEYYQYFTDDSYRTKVDVPHFSEKSWMAFPVLRGAYKYVQLQFEFKPEKLNGVILLTGERDDLTGDFIAVLINNGFIEFWFDCGSGIGKVISAESVILNQWNTLIVYRYRWDAWILLNQGKRVQGRSKGLFSRITFREPIFLGGTGNITGIDKKISISDGFIGCIRKFVANEQEYVFSLVPFGNATQIFDVHECQSDDCNKPSYRTGKKCLSNDQDTIPSFNGSSYLTYAPLDDKALIWFELKMVLKAKGDNGVVLYSGHEEHGDFISLSIVMGYVEFMFDLGSGPAILRSTFRLTLDKWHKVHVSRTARLAVLKIDEHAEVMTISPKGFWHLSLPKQMYLGGISSEQYLPETLKERGSLIGCIQKVEINGRPLDLTSEATGGSNVDDCPHACTTEPCGSLARCKPNFDSYECVCNQFNDQCRKELLTTIATTTTTTTMTPTTTATTSTEPSTKQPTSSNTHEFHRAPTVDDQAISITIDSKIESTSNDIRDQKFEAPSLINNQIEVSVMVPTMDVIEEDFANVYNANPRKVAPTDNPHVKYDLSKRRSHKSKFSKRRNGVCFSGDESYFHFHDEETKRQIINYNVDINLRMKTYSANGLILWAGPHTGLAEGDYIMLGIENGYLHLRFDLGSGEMNLEYNVTKINDGLWHRIRASRDSQQGALEIDGGKAMRKTSPGELRKLNADTVLYVGGMPDVTHFTKRRYHFGIVGCISEIVLGGELKLDLNTETNAKSKNHRVASHFY